jgi:hypothetical protein
MSKAPKRHKVFFGATEEDTHICVSLTKPEFCFFGATYDEVRGKAERALNFYFETSGSIPKRESALVSRTNKVVSFVPQKSEDIEYIEA